MITDQARGRAHEQREGKRGRRRACVCATWLGRVGEDPAGELIVRGLHAERVELLASPDRAPPGSVAR